MLKRIAFIVSIWLLTLQVQAQNFTTLTVTRFGVGGILGFPDTIFGGTSYLINMVITNIGNMPFTNTPANPLTILMQADSSFLPYELAQTNSLFTLQPGDTTSITIVDSFPQGVFKLGNNVVVVWPSKNAPLDFTADSTYVYTYYVGFSGVNDFDAFGLKVYPTVFNDIIYLKPYNEQPFQFSLCNAFGQIVLSGHNPSALAVSHLNSGLYYLYIKQKNKVLFATKLIKL